MNLENVYDPTFEGAGTFRGYIVAIMSFICIPARIGKSRLRYSFSFRLDIKSSGDWEIGWRFNGVIYMGIYDDNNVSNVSNVKVKMSLIGYLFFSSVEYLFEVYLSNL